MKARLPTGEKFARIFAGWPLRNTQRMRRAASWRAAIASFDVDKIQDKLRGCDSNNDGGAFESRDGGRLLGWWPSRRRFASVCDWRRSSRRREHRRFCLCTSDRSQGWTTVRGTAWALHASGTGRKGRNRGSGIEYGDAIIAVERNNHGHAVLAHLTAAKYPNLFGPGKSSWAG